MQDKVYTVNGELTDGSGQNLIKTNYKILRWLPIMILIITSMPVFVLTNMGIKQLKLNNSTAEMTGIVASLTRHPSSSNGGNCYDTTVEYIVDSIKYINTFHSSIYTERQVGETITVYYQKNDPTNSALGTLKIGPYISLSLAGLILIAGLIGFFIVNKRIKKELENT